MHNEFLWATVGRMQIRPDSRLVDFRMEKPWAIAQRPGIQQRQIGRQPKEDHSWDMD